MTSAHELFVDTLTSPLLLFLVQFALTLFLTRVLGKLFSYLRQPQVVGEIIAGIILGPSVLGHVPGFTSKIFPTKVLIAPGKFYDSTQTFSVIANLGLIMFMFLMGMELDQSLLYKQWKPSVVIATSAIIFPFGVGVASSYWLTDINSEHQPADWKQPSSVAYTLFAGASMSFTAFPVLAAILMATKLLNTPVGVQCMSCAAIDDILAWCVLAISSAFSKSNSPVNGLYTCLMAFVYVCIMLAAVRPGLAFLHGRLQSRNLANNRYYLCFIFLMLVASAFTTEVIGIHSFFGAFLMGLITPKEGGFTDVLAPKMELIVTEALLPLYFANSGIRTNIGTLDTARYWGITLAIICIACVAKFTPACLTSKLVTGRGWRFCVTVGVLMNTRGLVEVIALNIGLSAGILSTRMFTMLILMAIVTTLLTSPLVYLIYQRNYDPSLEEGSVHAQMARTLSHPSVAVMEAGDIEDIVRKPTGGSGAAGSGAGGSGKEAQAAAVATAATIQG